MTKNDKKLELTWYNKDKSLYYDPDKKEYLWVNKKDPRVSEPRILLEKAVFGDPNSENILIKGDNLLALKALLSDYENTIKLIYIDPPFNTGTAFEFYDDGLEHSIWLTMMRDRLKLLNKLLSSEGSIFVHIDFNELSYLQVLLDEIFGRKNFQSLIAWQRAPEGRTVLGQGQTPIVVSTEYVLVYAKNREKLKMNYAKKVTNATEKVISQYKLILDNVGKRKLLGEFSDVNGNIVKLYSHESYKLSSIKSKDLLPSPLKFYLKNFDKIVQSVGIQKESTFQQRLMSRLPKDKLCSVEFVPSRGKREGEFVTDYFLSKRKLLFLKDFSVPRRDGIYREVDMNNFWSHDEIGVTGTAGEGYADFRRGKKPEALIQRILEIGSEDGDWVLDSFAGSGTTGAVAHKMGRKWIMVELENHAETHIIPRLKTVISGKDQSGISKEVSWNGGGGFKYFELGDSLFVRDRDLRLTVINPKMYNGPLIRAVLKIEGFRLLNPDNALHGISGKTVAHVTEQYLNQAYVDVLVNEVGAQADYLVIYAKTISNKLKLPESIEVRKIPDVLLRRFKA